MRPVQFLRRVLVVTLLAAITPVIALSQQSTTLDQAEEAAIRALILETIRENPEILVETLLFYQAEVEAEAAANRTAVLAKATDLLLSDENAGVLGNPHGSTTVVEFFDYNCPYCRRATPILLELIEENSDLRIVLREWPILGPDSELAARASLAALRQGGFAAFHEVLMAQPRANAATVRRAAEQAGLDYDRLLIDMEAPDVASHIETSRRVAAELGISGTPTFLIGDTLVPGFLEKPDMQAHIAEAADEK